MNGSRQRTSLDTNEKPLRYSRNVISHVKVSRDASSNIIQEKVENPQNIIRKTVNYEMVQKLTTQNNCTTCGN